MSCLLILFVWCYACEQFYTCSVGCPFCFSLRARFSDQGFKFRCAFKFCAFQETYQFSSHFFLRTAWRRTERRSYEPLSKKARLIWSIDDSCKKTACYRWADAPACSGDCSGYGWLVNACRHAMHRSEGKRFAERFVGWHGSIAHALTKKVNQEEKNRRTYAHKCWLVITRTAFLHHYACGRASIALWRPTKAATVSCCQQEYIRTRVCNIHHTLVGVWHVGIPTNVTFEGTYLVKNVRARFEYRKTIGAHEKQVIMQEDTQPCSSWWCKTLCPKRILFLQLTLPLLTMCVCL